MVEPARRPLPTRSPRPYRSRLASRTALCLALLPGSATLAQTPLHEFHGSTPGGWFGYSVDGAGDVNGDGYGDVVVGSWREGTDTGAARVYSGLDGAVLLSQVGGSTEDWFGYAVAGVGDVDGDGYDDVIVGAPQEDSTTLNAGTARVFSGFDGSTLLTFDGASSPDRLGASVSAAGDVNGDGVPDLVVGGPSNFNNGNLEAGRARVYSGLDGTLLHSFEGGAFFDQLGISVSGAGDVDMDGRPDVLVGVHRADGGGVEAGSATLYSGLDGSLIRSFLGSSAGDLFGQSVDNAGDVNNDGYPDQIVGARQDDDNGESSGTARVLSGLDGAPLYTFAGDAAGDWFGLSVSGAGDLDGDGHDDLLVGAPQDDDGAPDAGVVHVLSGLDGSVLTTLTGSAAGDWLGFSVRRAGDVDGDGVPDVVAGAFGDDTGGLDAGAVRVYSGAELVGPLSGAPSSISLAGGGTQTLKLAAGSGNAGRLYFLLGTTSGSSPGIPLAPGVTLPLNIPDAYFDFTLKKPNSGLLANSLNLLDGQGRSTATFNVPAGADPLLAGTTATHAYVLVLPSLDFASNAVDVTLVP